MSKESAMNSDRRIATDDAFERDVLQSALPVLVRFSAEWSGPCRIMGPVVSAAATEFQDKLIFADVDIDSGLEAIGRFGVRLTPTVILLNHGQEMARKSGPMTKEALIR